MNPRLASRPVVSNEARFGPEALNARTTLSYLVSDRIRDSIRTRLLMLTRSGYWIQACCKRVALRFQFGLDFGQVCKDKDEPFGHGQCDVSLLLSSVYLMLNIRLPNNFLIKVRRSTISVWTRNSLDQCHQGDPLVCKDMFVYSGLKWTVRLRPHSRTTSWRIHRSWSELKPPTRPPVPVSSGSSLDQRH